MPVPPLRDLITPTSTAAGLPAQTVNERFLLTLAMLATGTAPDGTTLPAGVAAGPPVAGYTAWYDASQITATPDNTALASWSDLSGNNNTMTQGTAAKRPIYYSTTSAKLVNGKPTAWFTYSGSALTSSCMQGTTALVPQSVFVIGQVNSLADTETFIGAAANTGWQLRVNLGKLDLIKQGTADVLTSTSTVPLTPMFVAATYDGATASLYINSATPDKTASVANTMVSEIPTIGANVQASEFLTGPICEILLYPTVLTGPQITSTYTYLKTKWGTP